MRVLLCGTVLVVLAATASVSAGTDSVDQSCDVCTCQNGEVICLTVSEDEVLEEQVVCGNACALVDSTHGTRERVETPCSEVLQCQHRSAPAANSMWLGLGVVALLGAGAVLLRRTRATVRA